MAFSSRKFTQHKYWESFPPVITHTAEQICSLIVWVRLFLLLGRQLNSPDLFLLTIWFAMCRQLAIRQSHSKTLKNETPSFLNLRVFAGICGCFAFFCGFFAGKVGCFFFDFAVQIWFQRCCVDFPGKKHPSQRLRWRMHPELVLSSSRLTRSGSPP